MELIGGGLLLALVAGGGAAMAFRAQAILGGVARFYRNDAISGHIQTPPFILGLRLVGCGWMAFAAITLVGSIAPQISR
jgi:hypothetical protein